MVEPTRVCAESTLAPACRGRAKHKHRRHPANLVLAFGPRLAVKDIDGRLDGVKLRRLVVVEPDFQGLYLAGKPPEGGLAAKNWLPSHAGPTFCTQLPIPALIYSIDLLRHPTLRCWLR